jgi:hypothetical protein
MTRRSFFLLFITSFCLVPSAFASEFAFDDSAKWADFGVGSWKLVRVYKETFDEKRTIVSVSIDETKSTLVDVTEEGYTIRADVVIEVAGKRLTAAPTYFKKYWHSNTADGSVKMQDAGERDVKITGRLYPTQVHKIWVQGKDSKTHSTVYYSDDVAPYVLRMETTGTDVKSQKTSFNSVVEVIAVEMPHKVLSEIKTASHVQTSEQHHSSGEERVTVEIQCPSVPGWVIAHSSKRVNKKDDRVVERTTLELLDYEALPVQTKSDPLVTRRRGRLRRNRPDRPRRG